MTKPDFTDGELGWIRTVLGRADPIGLIQQTTSVLQKIAAYEAEKEKANAEKSTKPAP
jgi:hypothetical protein